MLESKDLQIHFPMSGLLGGTRRSNAYGSSVEFADYREYTPGDDLRRIDWNLYARFEKLYLRLTVDERQLHHRIYIDSSASMAWGGPSKGQMALKLAAALIALSFFALGSLPFLEGYTLFDLFGKVTLAGGPLQEAAALLFRILAWASFANLALALIGMVVPHTATAALIRAALHFALAGTALVVLGFAAGWNALPQYSGTLAYTALALAQLLFAAVTLGVLRKRNAPAESGAEGAAPPPAAPKQAPARRATQEGYGAGMRAAVSELLEEERRAAGDIRDEFLDELTDGERREFCDLFIDRIYGESLPCYRPGEDNAAFFRTVFIRLGKYRDVISDDLLEKLYERSQHPAGL